MLPKKNRAGRREIEKIFQKGKFIFSSGLNFKFILNRNGENRRISFVVPKNIVQTAVKRNLLRRRGYVALKKYLNKFPAGILGTLIFKKPEENISIIENDIENILNKIN
ncbi:hypothetical protein A3I95_00430 [Candidatus Nomurabacteria bacterium RIFCSPLOWO2_02_FULL_44_12]|uniref:Uncharacterized protein n=1 Tax=Candidatus Nomurabacteria bacterium RIFCSPLOWO2_12_FULL_44_11 TaxID=1801796 RepID=A0A1F6Y6Q8_9BACT|nr:MAG: hypothetical protein A3E95_02755 [Candidatus Nomurabacteria bacterium RIFCSPHIGHO2_12_FULL_44_22b]OGJ02005.1 MAG: hypothetical protein A3G53_01845 [Candidatus Nomurabacteria bacterium RIFCSPLOWO2_12_FULL_44_11]OGJ08739.1 MAG: hypothetical protein A3I95_00430 [Candidatus Nomurabacteria bacterium RIFCSPLOWO2_02_FULL_44_12]